MTDHPSSLDVLADPPLGAPHTEPCFACGRPLLSLGTLRVAVTSDGQRVFVGPECWRLIRQAGAAGYQPPSGGPRLFTGYPYKTEPSADGRS